MSKRDALYSVAHEQLLVASAGNLFTVIFAVFISRETGAVIITAAFSDHTDGFKESRRDQNRHLQEVRGIWCPCEKMRDAWRSENQANN